MAGGLGTSDQLVYLAGTEVLGFPVIFDLLDIINFENMFCYPCFMIVVYQFLFKSCPC